MSYRLHPTGDRLTAWLRLDGWAVGSVTYLAGSADWMAFRLHGGQRKRCATMEKAIFWIW